MIQGKDPISKLSPAQIRRYAPTPDAYFELLEQVTTAVGEALGAGNIQVIPGGATYQRQPSDNTKLVTLWKSKPLARAFIETMISVQPKIRGLIEGESK